MNTLANNADEEAKQTPAVLRAMRILEYLADGAPANPTQVARDLKIPRTGAFRILTTLADTGYLWRDPDTGNFTLTARLFAIGSKAPSLRVRELARPLLGRLRDETEETAELVVRDADQMLILDAVDSKQSIRLHARPGRSYPLFRMATGRVWLAHMPTADVRRLYDSGALDTQPLPDSFEALQDKLSAIREDACATDEGYARPDVERIASPVYGVDGLVAAIGIAGPKFRLKPTKEIIQKVESAARDLSLSLGCTEWPIGTRSAKELTEGETAT